MHTWFYESYEDKFRNALREMNRLVQDLTEVKEQKLGLLAAQLDAVSPLRVLSRGYSMTLNEKGNIIKSVDMLRWGEEIRTRLHDGEIYSVIQQIERRKDNGR